ncbi:hypothetical protein [Microvirga calopogonii]|uniref:hypothetical protein n=1 Tax=Microvirga calopogonii TaxID=2078013 RepID=UPI000E0D6410|nr:hypothetical protein [Microvirga calopogonii]
MLSLSSDSFPTTLKLIRAKWAPILLRPILGSPEQLVIGVAAINSEGFHLERANCLERLQCLFSDAAGTAVVAAQTALDALSLSLASEGYEAIADYEPLFSGVVIGELKEAEGTSLVQIASTWMAMLSSVYKSQTHELTQLVRVQSDVSIEPDKATDRLPSLVLEYVSQRRPGLGKFFDAEIQEQNRRRRRTNIHGVIIDFAGSKIVANFGTLSATSYANSVDRIKRRLWDLKIDRDTEKGTMATRSHEMIIQHPLRNDPQITEKQYARIEEALQALEEQADQEEIRLRPLTTVPQIGEHILHLEAAA